MSLISPNFDIKLIIFSQFWTGAFSQNCWKKPCIGSAGTCTEDYVNGCSGVVSSYLCTGPVDLVVTTRDWYSNIFLNAYINRHVHAGNLKMIEFYSSVGIRMVFYVVLTPAKMKTLR